MTRLRRLRRSAFARMLYVVGGVDVESGFRRLLDLRRQSMGRRRQMHQGLARCEDAVDAPLGQVRQSG